MTRLVLVDGAWLEAWARDKVVAELRAAAGGEPWRTFASLALEADTSRLSPARCPTTPTSTVCPACVPPDACVACASPPTPDLVRGGPQTSAASGRRGPDG
ncbi:hypothetical protein [Streptomyces incanus]|uniref:Uncharacterized protein n=1 Tax=Streptomyces incanus TaxID=887453 RepID=A0ABW0XMM1_9ACTN